MATPGATDGVLPLPPSAGVSIEVKLAGALAAPSPSALPSLLAGLEALAGRPPSRLLEHEVVLRSPLPSGGEVRLVRDLTEGDGSGSGAQADLRVEPAPPPAPLRRSVSSGADEAEATAAAAAATGPPPPPPSDAAWVATHYGQRLRGRAASALPTAARPRTAVPVSGTDVPAAWVAAGFTPSHEAVRDGVVVSVAGQGGHTVRVAVSSLLRVVARAGLPPPGGEGAAAPLLAVPGLPPDAAALPAAPGLVLVEAASVGGEVEYAAAAADVAGVAEALRRWVVMGKD